MRHLDLEDGHNHLLDWYQGADGIKTGFINASGFNLAASAVRDGHRQIGVIMGGRSWRSRDVQMASLLDQGFAALAAARPTQPQYASVAAAAAPPAAVVTPPATAAALPTAAPAASPPAAAVPAPPPAAPTDTADAHQRPEASGNLAQSALRHLSFVAKAEASPLPNEASDGGADWAIQLGAFRAEAAAEQAAHRAAGLAIGKGRPTQILAPSKRDANRLYRARLLHFTAKGAQAACAELHRKGFACSVIHAGGVKVASR